jgi:hypothetical protein
MRYIHMLAGLSIGLTCLAPTLANAQHALDGYQSDAQIPQRPVPPARGGMNPVPNRMMAAPPSDGRDFSPMMPGDVIITQNAMPGHRWDLLECVGSRCHWRPWDSSRGSSGQSDLARASFEARPDTSHSEVQPDLEIVNDPTKAGGRRLAITTRQRSWGEIGKGFVANLGQGLGDSLSGGYYGYGGYYYSNQSMGRAGDRPSCGGCSRR